MANKNFYIGIFESKKFHGIELSSKIHSATAKSPESAIYFMIRRELSDNLSQRAKSKTASDVREKLSREDGGINKIIYEVEEDLTQDEKKISRYDKNYKDAITGFLASAISKKKGGNELTHLETAKEAIELYWEQKGYYNQQTY